MNWYLKKIFAQQGGMLDYLATLGTTPDVTNYIASLDQKTGQILVNEVRKNPSITLEQLQQFQTPQQSQQVDPYLPSERRLAENFGLEFPQFSKWILVSFRKIRKGILPKEDHKGRLEEAIGLDNYFRYRNLRDKITEIRDWAVRMNPEISSYSPEEAIQASDQWHRMMAGEGEGTDYEPTNADMILYGPEWKNPEWQGWTIQKVTSENDLLAEGNKMDHCVGGFCRDVESGQSVIYSLRDPQNNPHVTIEIGGDKSYGPGTIEQIQGKSNSIPKDDYKAMVKEWISTSGDDSGIVKEVNAFEKMEDDINIGNIGEGVLSVTDQIDKILQGEESEYGLKYVIDWDWDMDDIITNLVENGESENSVYGNTLQKYHGDIVDSPPYVTNLALMEDLKLPNWPRHSGEWEELRKMPKQSDWKNIQEVERWAHETIDEIQEDFHSDDTGYEYPQEEDYENPGDYEVALKMFDDGEAETHKEWLKQSVKGGFALDLLDEIKSFRDEGIVPSAQELYDRKKKKQEEALTSSPAYQNAYDRGAEMAQQPTASSKNWYKKAQINDGKSKITENGLYYVILGKNTKQGEGPWRVSAIQNDGVPYGHEHFPTYEEALEKYNSIEGIEKNVYELV